MWIAHISFLKDGKIRKEQFTANTCGKIYQIVGVFLNREKVQEVHIQKG